MTNHCPFCGNYAYAASVGDAYRLDCRYCEIQIEITKRAYAARCPNPVAVLEYIREKMKGSTRPRVDIADMKRSRPPLMPETETNLSDRRQASAPGSERDVLTAAAKTIGTTLGKIAVKTGIAKLPASPKKAPSKAVPKKVTKKAPAAKAAPGIKRNTASKTSPRKPASKRKQGR